MKSAPISVIIPTFNEEANLEAALDSVRGWAEEIFVVDSFSTDRTVEMALARAGQGVRVVQHAFENYSSQWNWALQHLPLTQPWILKLDADERATEGFRHEVARCLAEAGEEKAAFVVHVRPVFMGSPLRWGGLYPNGHLRIWRRGRGRFEDREVNEHLVVSGEIGAIANPVDHHDTKGLGHWLDRHNRYSAMEARALISGNVVGEVEPKLFGRPDQRRMWLRKVYYRVPLRSLWYFCYRFFFRLGFLDGRPGFRFAYLHASFLYWIDLKRSEHRRTGRMPEILWPARGKPHPEVASSDLQGEVDAPRP